MATLESPFPRQSDTIACTLIGTSPDSLICSMSRCNDYVAILVSSVNVSRVATSGYVVVVSFLCLSACHLLIVFLRISILYCACSLQQRASQVLLLAALLCSSYTVNICHGLVALGHSGSQHGCIKGGESIQLDIAMWLLLWVSVTLAFQLLLEILWTRTSASSEFWRTNVLHSCNVH